MVSFFVIFTNSLLFGLLIHPKRFGACFKATERFLPLEETETHPLRKQSL
jgi:hypothetical protein